VTVHNAATRPGAFDAVVAVPHLVESFATEARTETGAP
jgi:hypothetical protein